MKKEHLFWTCIKDWDEENLWEGDTVMVNLSETNQFWVVMYRGTDMNVELTLWADEFKEHFISNDQIKTQKRFDL